MKDVGDISVRSPCPRCTRLWLPRAVFDGRRGRVAEIPAKRGELVSVTTSEGTLGPAPFLPHPDCDRGHRNATCPFDERLVGPLGPAKALRAFPALPDGPQVRQAIGDAPRCTTVRPFLCGCGVADDASLAARIAIAEVLERDCAHRKPRAAVVEGTAEELGIRDWTCAGRRRWVLARSWANGAPRPQPLEAVQLSSLCDVDAPLVRGDSTGMAIHLERDAARAAGLAEVAECAALADLWERGAMLVWRADSFPVAARRLFESMHATAAVTVLPLRPALGHHVCVAIADTGTRASKRMLWGAAARSTPEEALVATLRELYGLLCIEASSSRSESHETRRVLAALGVATLPRADFPAAPPPLRARMDDVTSVDRGNTLTDALGLFVEHVIVPSLHPTRASSFVREGAAYPFY
jgi:hypothetical protein